MNYFRYTNLFFWIFCGIFVAVFAALSIVDKSSLGYFVNFVAYLQPLVSDNISVRFSISPADIINVSNMSLIDVIIVITLVVALFIASIIISNKIIKSNSRVMTFSEIVKYALCFSIVTAMVNMTIKLLLTPVGMLKVLPFTMYILVFCKMVVIILVPIQITMFLVNKYFKNRYKNGLKSIQEDKPKNGEFRGQLLTSTILFMVFICGCMLYILASEVIEYQTSIISFNQYYWLSISFSELLNTYIIPYFIYLVISLVVVYFAYRKMLFLNIIALLVIVTIIGLKMNGFCYKTKSFMNSNKAAIIDKAIALHIKSVCNHEKDVRKEMGLEEKECSISLESIKEEAPHCFTKDRPDECKGDITYFNGYSGFGGSIEVVKESIVIYKVNEMPHLGSSCFLNNAIK
ncbi:MAG: hypothetical protein LBG67_04225 [Campylobacteraceae bacterium]|jgi:hypothetical protein|nr:hypothetical protein [Campylobacteraceae bacterium]